MKPIIFLSVLLSSLTLSAQQSGSLAERFDRIDRNRDGKVTPEELPQPQLFQRLDRNGDGVIERSDVGGATAPNRPRSAGTGDLVMPKEPPQKKHLNLRYAEIAGVEPNLLSLDLYVPDDKQTAAKCPVMIMIHGGGWRNGDKASPAIVGAKMRHFVGRGYIYATINYRLSQQTPQEDGIKHPVHAMDCASAIAWIHDHIAQYGGDPQRLHLMGHSAGGHLAAIVGTNERFLKARGKDLSILKSNVLLDPAALDIPRYIELVEGRSMTALYEVAFGKDEANWRDASPQLHVAPGKKIPPTLIFYAGNRMNLDVIAPAFADSLTKAGSPARAVDTVTLDHGQINSHIGMVDEPMTALIMRLHADEDASRFPARLESVTKAAGRDEPPARPLPKRFSGTGEPAARPYLDKENVAPLQVTFTKDYFPGTKNRHGQFMGGTETMRLAAHNGMLFAGNGFWTDQPGNDPQPGAQILVKRGANEPWEVERNFPGALRINCMEPVTFTTDHTGKPLSKPVTLLFADAALVAARDEGPLSVWVRDDEAQKWIESRVTANAPRAYVRAFGAHRDRKTGIDLVFAGTGAGEIYAGVYDPAAPGRVRWNPKPEYAKPDFDGTAFRRCQGFCVANGKAYASISPSLVERQDGPNPSWHEVFRWKPTGDRGGQGLRGITAVPALKGDHEVILGSREQEGRILRIDPINNYAVELELQSDAFLKEKLGNFRGGRLVAYNRFEPGKDPRTGQPIHWVTVAGVKPDDMQAAWLMIRHADATYEPVRVFDAKLDPHPFLVSTRTLEFAPWSDREFYTGGYDGAANNRSNHNTAWICKGTLPAKP
jgi:acetyl esterase/lipase